MIDAILIAVTIAMMITMLIWGTVQFVKIHRESKELERQIDEWYEKELAWLKEMMKDEDDD